MDFILDALMWLCIAFLAGLMVWDFVRKDGTNP